MDILILGFANLIADGISMGFGDFVSSSTEKEVAAKERAVTKWDVNNNNTAQQEQLLHQYQRLGMDINDATTVKTKFHTQFLYLNAFKNNSDDNSNIFIFLCCKQVVNIFAKYNDILVDEKMTVQRGMLPPEGSEKPWKNGLVTLAAFLVFGSAPLLSFIILIPFTDNDTVKFLGACVLSVLALGFLGMVKAKIASQNYFTSASMTIFNGVFAAAAAYALGWILRNKTGLEEDHVK